MALFSATGGCSSLQVSGPFAVTGNSSFQLQPGVYTITARKNSVLLVSKGNGRRRIIQQRLFSLKGASGAPLTVAIPGKPARQYFGTIDICSQGQDEPPTGELSGRFTVTAGRRQLKIINSVSRRDYVASVVASEMPAGAPAEALKAQAVLANTQLAKLPAGKILDDSTQIQSYLGAPKARPEAYAAVDQIQNQILNYGHRPIEAFFHSTCAGRTSKPEAIFGSQRGFPYLTNVRCTNCERSPFFNPLTVIIPKAKFATVFGAELPRITAVDVAGRATEMRYEFHGKTVVSSGYQFCLKLGQAFGWGKAPGTRFTLLEQNGEVQIKSTGAGHGVGLCQWGAIGMAKKKMNYKQILEFYYPGATIGV